MFRCGVLRRTEKLMAMLRPAWSADLLVALEVWLEKTSLWVGEQRPLSADANIDVLEHGSRRSRRYRDRQFLLSSLVPDRHIRVDDDRLFRWTRAGLDLVEPGVRAYFRSRLEDEPSVGPRTGRRPSTTA